jgi:hypothetical protein
MIYIYVILLTVPIWKDSMPKKHITNAILNT